VIRNKSVTRLHVIGSIARLTLRTSAAIALFLASAMSYGADWGQAKLAAAINSIEITSPESQVTLLWPGKVVPGEQLLTSKSTITRYQLTTFRRYVFVGIVGNSMQIGVTGASQSKDAKSARSDGSFDATLFVERAPDSAFYFVPDDLKDEGHLRVTRSAENPAYYLVSVVKRQN
jgi:hypothetical protein